MDESSKDSAAMGQAFDASKNDDSFYLPPEVFENPDFKRALNSFLSPDGKAARFIISHNGDPASPEGIARINPQSALIKQARMTPITQLMASRRSANGQQKAAGRGNCFFQ